MIDPTTRSEPGTRAPFLHEPPQVHERISSGEILATSLFCLLPAAAWGTRIFGMRAALVLATAVLSSLVAETIIVRLFRPRFHPVEAGAAPGWHAAFVGLVIGMMMPPGVPLGIVIVATVFAMGVAKWTFGGISGIWLHPALTAWVFVVYSWPDAMTRWTAPATLPPDGVTSATALGLLRVAAERGEVVIGGLAGYLGRVGVPRTALDASVTGWFNEVVSSRFGTALPVGYVDLFLGNHPGAIGETSVALLLLGSVVLFGRRIITWEIPTAFFLSFASLTWVFGGHPYGAGLFSGDVLFHLLTGSVVFAMFFIATDPSCAPRTAVGQIVFGLGAGALTVLFRRYSGGAEGVAGALLVMNILTPAINQVFRPRRYGWSLRASR